METTQEYSQKHREGNVEGRRVFLPSSMYWYSAGSLAVVAAVYLILILFAVGSTEVDSRSGWAALVGAILLALVSWNHFATAAKARRSAIVLDDEGLYMHQCAARLTGEQGDERLGETESALIPWDDIESIGIRRIRLKDGTSYTNCNYWSIIKSTRYRYHYTTYDGTPFKRDAWTTIIKEFEARQKY